MKIRAEAIAEESKNPRQGMDSSHTEVAREIGAAPMDESDSKFIEEVFEVINSTWREHEEELYYDAISGEVMMKELVDAARKVEMETFKKHAVYEKVPTEELCKSICKAPVGVSGQTRTRATRRFPSTGVGW